MKLFKIIASVALGRIIHVGIKAVFPLTTNDPDTAFLVGGTTGAGSILLGFAVVFGLSGYLRKRNENTQSKASRHEPPNE